MYDDERNGNAALPEAIIFTTSAISTSGILYSNFKLTYVI
jgi:hypothetical protein